jgi:hypothetical protein
MFRDTTDTANAANTPDRTDRRGRTVSAVVFLAILAVAVGVGTAPGTAGNHDSLTITEANQGPLSTPESADEMGTDESQSVTAGDDEESDHVDDQGFEADGDISAYALLAVLGIAIAVDLRRSRV